MIEIFITTSKRPEWCLQLLHDIERESCGMNYNVRVFHDYAPDDNYHDVIEYCNERENTWYYRAKEAEGRRGFWKLNNLMYGVLDSLTFDYYIQLSDDVVLVENFLFRAVDTLEESEMDILNIFTLNIHHKTFEQHQLIQVNGLSLRRNNWVDCIFIAKPEAIKGMRIEPMDEHYMHQNYNGSGVAHSFIEYYNRRIGKKIHQMEYSLVEHIGYNTTAMHLPDRLEKFYGKNIPFEGHPLRCNLTETDRKYVELKM